jgi:phage terminase small subunit
MCIESAANRGGEAGRAQGRAQGRAATRELLGIVEQRVTSPDDDSTTIAKSEASRDLHLARSRPTKLDPLAAASRDAVSLILAATRGVIFPDGAAASSHV